MTNFGRILDVYGETVKTGGENSFKAFIQPAITGGNYKNTQLGTVNVGDYYIFAPAASKLERGMSVFTGDAEFVVVRAEKLRVMGKISHIEGVLKRKEHTYVH